MSSPKTTFKPILNLLKIQSVRIYLFTHILNRMWTYLLFMLFINGLQFENDETAIEHVLIDLGMEPCGECRLIPIDGTDTVLFVESYALTPDFKINISWVFPRSLFPDNINDLDQIPYYDTLPWDNGTGRVIEDYTHVIRI